MYGSIDYHDTILAQCYLWGSSLTNVDSNLHRDGGDSYLFLFMCFVALMSAYATLAASMFSGLVFGMPDITKKSAYLAGWLYVVVTIVIMVALMPLWSAIFGILY